jgi:hypothetical protein
MTLPAVPTGLSDIPRSLPGVPRRFPNKPFQPRSARMAFAAEQVFNSIGFASNARCRRRRNFFCE